MRMIIKFFVWMTAYSPSFIRISVGKLLGFTAFMLFSDLRKVVIKNLEITGFCLEGKSCHKLVRNVFVELGIAVTQLGPIWSWNIEKTLSLILEVQGIDQLNDAIKKNKGVILFTGHFGSWEFLNQYLAVYWSISIIYRRIDNDVLETLIKNFRTRTGSILLEKKAALRPLIRALREGKMVGVLTDQNVDKHEGIFSPFFGRMASTSPLVASLARVRYSPIFGVFATRTKDHKKIIIKFKELKYDAENFNEQFIIDRQNQILEEEINKNPEQYWWFHKRFKAVKDDDLYPYDFGN